VTRPEYVQIFKGFHRFLQARKAAEIEAAFGVKLVCPVDEFNASRHLGDDFPAELPPPSPERVAEFLRVPEDPHRRGRKYAPAARDYALFRTLYHAGLRSQEAALLDWADVHFGRGPFGKLHVRGDPAGSHRWRGILHRRPAPRHPVHDIHAGHSLIIVFARNTPESPKNLKFAALGITATP
jgi:integrase